MELRTSLLAFIGPFTALADPTPGHVALVQPIDAVVVTAMFDPTAVGLSVAVTPGDETLLTRGYGLAEVEHDVPANAATTFRVGSITKQFTAAAVMRLFEQDKLHIDEDMCAYLPDYPAGDEVVTVRNLLTHTSGIPSYTDLSPVFWDDVARDMTHEELLATFVDLPLVFRPGQRWAYNNYGYYLLDVLMSMNAPGSAGAEDLVLRQLALVSGTVVSEESFVEMATAFMLAAMTEASYGMGLQLREMAGRTLVCHGGGIYGFNSFLAHLPLEGVSVAVISKCEEFSSQRVAYDILTAALEQ